MEYVLEFQRVSPECPDLSEEKKGGNLHCEFDPSVVDVDRNAQSKDPGRSDREGSLSRNLAREECGLTSGKASRRSRFSVSMWGPTQSPPYTRPGRANSRTNRTIQQQSHLTGHQRRRFQGEYQPNVSQRRRWGAQRQTTRRRFPNNIFIAAVTEADGTADHTQTAGQTAAPVCFRCGESDISAAGVRQRWETNGSHSNAGL